MEPSPSPSRPKAVVPSGGRFERRGADRAARTSVEGRGAQVINNNDRIVRNLAAMVALLLLFGAGAVLVRSSRKQAPSVLGTRQSQPPFVTETADPSTFPAPQSPEPLPSLSLPPEESPSPSPSAIPASCRNSYSPSCGPFSWTRSPGSNGGMRISVTYPTGGFTGQPVEFTVTLTDPDAKPLAVYPRWGDGASSTAPACTQQRYGPWDPPARSGGSKTYVLRHTYTRAGTYTVSFVGRTGYCGNPYGNELKSQAFSVTIQATGTSPSPSPSPSETPFPI